MKDLRRPVFALQQLQELASGGPAGGSNQSVGSHFVTPELIVTPELTKLEPSPV
jgi:hypothetical protein